MIDTWIAIIIAIVTLVGTATPLILGLRQAAIIGKTNAIEALKNGNWIRIGAEIFRLIQEVEKFINLSGVQKKDWVVAKLIMFCKENNIEFDIDKIKAEIDTIVAMTRTVNTDGKYLT